MLTIEASYLICDTITKTLPYYPCRVCGTHAAKASDESRRTLGFFNTSIGGGSITYHADLHRTETHPDHLCLIDGVRCYADEVRFGGIIIRTLTNQLEQ